MDTQSSKHKYKMTIGLSVLEHLGVGLYSNIPAVLSEAVANAWDADAELVEIDISPERREIVIRDDGSGMTVDDINEKYLKVGYKKREREPSRGITPRFRRQPMGRKGIGKLSLFSIADVIEIHTVKNGEANAFRMNGDDIRAKIESETSDDYFPEALPEALIEIEQGTRIKLTKLKKRISRTDEFLRKRLARRFSIIGRENFSIEIDGIPISARDRDYYRSIQYLWYFGDESEHYKEKCRNIAESRSTLATVDSEQDFRISGWIGTVENQSQIYEAINGIVIFANGKLVHENMLKDMKEGGVWTKYVIGEIDANYLDSDEEDIITSARQSLQEDHPRFTQLKEFIQQGVIREIATNWLRWRRKEGERKSLRDRPNVRRWYDLLQGDQKDHARQLFGRIEALDGVKEADKKEFYKVSMIAFERLSITQQLSILSGLETERDFELVSKIFKDLTDLARVHYYNIAKVRIEIIKRFEKDLDNDKKEKVIQKHIFDALWLLDPSWDRTTTNRRMEKTVHVEFKKETDKLSQDEKRARIDIRFQTVAGKHVIIELKRYSANVNVHDLSRQLNKYKRALEKCLAQKFPEEDKSIEIVCITGSQPSKSDPRQTVVDHLKAYSARYVTYDDLIKNALNSYQDYLKAEKRISELVEIIESIDEDFDT
ncbi:MAG: ATP-binding protein [Chloroflexota bacterium]|nr:ATP-binding protein [Chloroflexota bacterium]